MFRLFENGEAMAAALQAGEIDAAHNIPTESFESLDADEDIVGVVGQQGGFSELGMNAGEGGIGDGHPALLDVTVRQAINKAIDRADVARSGRARPRRGGHDDLGLARPDAGSRRSRTTCSLAFDPDGANQMLDDAGYLDTNGTVSARCPTAAASSGCATPSGRSRSSNRR